MLSDHVSNLVLVWFNLGHRPFHPEMKQLCALSLLHHHVWEENRKHTIVFYIKKLNSCCFKPLLLTFAPHQVTPT